MPHFVEPVKKTYLTGHHISGARCYITSRPAVTEPLSPKAKKEKKENTEPNRRIQAYPRRDTEPAATPKNGTGEKEQGNVRETAKKNESRAARNHAKAPWVFACCRSPPPQGRPRPREIKRNMTPTKRPVLNSAK